MKREQILKLLNRMKVGQRMTFERRTFDDAFMVGFLNQHARTPEDVCLNSLVGSNYGTFLIYRDPVRGNVTISRHEEQKRRVRVDVDREHLFEKTADGYYELKEGLS